MFEPIKATVDTASEDGIIRIAFSRPVKLELERRSLNRLLADDEIPEEYSEEDKEKLSQLIDVSYKQSSAVEEDHAEHSSMSSVDVNTATSTLIEL